MVKKYTISSSQDYLEDGNRDTTVFLDFWSSKNDGNSLSTNSSLLRSLKGETQYDGKLIEDMQSKYVKTNEKDINRA